MRKPRKCTKKKRENLGNAKKSEKTSEMHKKNGHQSYNISNRFDFFVFFVQKDDLIQSQPNKNCKSNPFLWN